MRKTAAGKLFPLFCGILLCAALFSGCEEEAPRIVSIDPRIGRMGDILTIRGSGFGNDRNESYITIADTPPTSSYYLFWSDAEIKVRLSEFGEAGLVYVHRGRTKSNAALFTDSTTIPELSEGDSGNIPRIVSIEPASASIGSLITIQGANFGSSRESSGVFFAWDSDVSPAVPDAPAGTPPPEFVEVSGAESGYESWTDREIRLRIPDGAVSGNLEVRTPRGNSQPVRYEVSGKPGTKNFRDKRSYVFSYSADIRIDEAAVPNALYIWMPHPVVSSSQKNVKLLSRSTEPFIENYRGTSLFQFVDTLPSREVGINLSYMADVYAVETNIRNQNPVRMNPPSHAGAVYILPSPLVPSGDSTVKTQAAQIIGRERLPYAKARRIYDWLLSSLEIQWTALSGGVSEALEEKKADSYRAALLFCALARAAEVPAVPVAGVLVNEQRETSRHFWAEFWLDGFGWIPVDPALGAGAAPAGFTLKDDHGRYYFGNLDNQRITFSRGERFINQMTPRGRTVTRTRDYSLQNLWEETGGGIGSYSSRWSDVTITGMYVQ